MSIVVRPFVLDFAGAWLGPPPDFSAELMADWEKEKRELFGPRWTEVTAVLSELRLHGVHMLDVSPGNVSFRQP